MEGLALQADFPIFAPKLKFMKQRIILFLRTFFAFTAASILGKLLFCGFYAKLMDAPSLADILAILWHGLPHDLSVAGYMTTLPGLMLAMSLWTDKAWLRWGWRFAVGAESLVLATAICVNIGLYEYWQFPLDATPLFYFFTSPADAFASVSLWTVLAGVAGIASLTALTVLVLHGKLPATLPKGAPTRRRRCLQTCSLLILTGLLFFPIRGGLTVSTMNTGHVFFSHVQARNHAAVAPLFSLVESLKKQNDFKSQYRFFDDKEAHAIFQALHTPTDTTATESAGQLLNTQKPDIVLIILESFSSKLMRTLGGESGVVPHLEQIAQEGLLFTNFYANSFRTDRGLVAILSGYPAQPTTSVMKYPRKTANLPSLTRSLSHMGYEASYFYGGDADFTNMRSYLINQGFSSIISDADFPVTERLSKWGIHDHLLFQRAFKDIVGKQGAGTVPHFSVIQTSSSHEPFNVPYHRLPNKRLNAFAYTDSCLGSFIHELSKSPSWERTLVVIVPDHLGAYPEHMSNFSPDRYRIPLVMTGGALARRGRVATVGSQIDIAATLYAALLQGQGNGTTQAVRKAFPFGKDLFNPYMPHFAFFCVPDAMGYADDKSVVVYDNQAGKAVVSQGEDAPEALRRAKAYLQCLYDDLAER